MVAKGANSRLRKKPKASAEIPASVHVPYTRLVDPFTIKTKDGALLRVFELKGFPYETASDGDIDNLKAIRNVIYRSMADPEIGIYTHIVRRRVEVDKTNKFEEGFAREIQDQYLDKLGQRRLYKNALYVTLIKKPSLLKKSKSFFSLKKKDKEPADNDNDHEDMRYLEERTDLLGAQLDTYGADLLGFKEGYDGVYFSEVLSFLYELINGQKRPVAVPRMNLAEYLTSHRITFGRESMHISGNHDGEETYGAIMSVKEYAPQTAAGALDHLLQMPFEFVLTQSFLFMGKQDSIDKLATKAKRYAATDDSKTLEYQLKEARDLVQSSQIAFGGHHLTLMVKANTPHALNQNVSQASSAFMEVGVIAEREDLNTEAAFWAQLPGNYGYIARSSGISTINFAGLSSLHNYPYGKKDGNLWGPCVTTFETMASTPYHFNFHVGDLANFLIIGPSGSGKTVLLGFLLSQAQRFQPRTIFFDKDRGADLLIRALGGRYAIIENGTSTGFNPLQLEDTNENREFISLWLTSLVGRPLKTDEEKLIDEAIVQNFEQPVKMRRLRYLIQLFKGHDKDSTLSSDLEKWHSNGRLSWVFDNPTDQLDLSARTVGFDLTSILDNEAIRGPVMLYMFHRAKEVLDGSKAMIFIDEGWKALSDPVFVEKIKDWLKTIRKQNGLVGFGSQSPSDALDSEIASSLLEQCPTKIFMPNTSANVNDYCDTDANSGRSFSLTEKEFEIVKKSPPGSRHFIVKQGQDAVVARLDLAGMDDHIAILSSRTATYKLAERIREEHGNELEDWLPKFYEQWRDV